MEKIKTILLIDDDESTLEIVTELLSDEYNIVAVNSGEEGLRHALGPIKPDLILLDVVMPIMDGYQVCKALKQNAISEDIPVIFLTVKGESDNEQLGFETGAVDYISKPFTHAIIKARVNTHIKLHSALNELKDYGDNLEKIVVERTSQLEEEVIERRKREVQLRYQATHDQLTGLPNRLLFHEHLIQSCKSARRHESKFALILIDLDRFKDINDSMGHHFGDQILKNVSSRLVKSIRDADMVARLGGDEFTLILDDIKSRDDVINIVKKIFDAVAKPYHIDNDNKHLEKYDSRMSASIGITLFPDDSDDPDVMLKFADMAMYNAKERGRNAYAFYSPTMATTIMDRINREKDLYKTLENNEFYICYQPIIDIQSNKIVGVEALLRWPHKEQGLIPPNIFIPIAEESDLITVIDEWVIENASREFENWIGLGIGDIHLSINLSRRQFERNNGPANRILSVLGKSNVPTSRLHLEITESLILDDNDSVIAELKTLRDNGVKLYIDDFGIGYSSLSCLQRFPIDALKIDRAFIRNMCSNENGTALVKGIITMARSLGMEVIAEGVETEDQRNLLLELGCNFIQGYYFSKPLISDEFVSYYHNWLKN
jgi:diguanylate cyclase (GGDEF)-like protein